MTKVRTGVGAVASMALGVFALAGCSGSDNNNKGSNPPPPVPEAVANYNLATGELPYPADPYFWVTKPGEESEKDGTLNIPKVPFRNEAMRFALNSQDGWGLAVEPWTGFSMPLLPASINGSTVKIIKVYLNPNNKAPVDTRDQALIDQYMPAGWPLGQPPVAGVLEYGVDYTAKVDPATDSGGRILTITPLKPFEASSGPYINAGRTFNIGYIVYLTNGLKSTIGQPFAADATYAAFKASPDCTAITDPSANAVCQFTQPQFLLAPAAGLTKDQLILSWSFSTQSDHDAFTLISATTTPKPTVIVPLFDVDTGHFYTTADVGGQGKANIYVGSTQLTYYQTPTSPLESTTQQNAAVNLSFWKAATTLPGQPYSYVTMFNPIPKPGSAETPVVTVPLLVTVPRTDGSSGCAGKPVGGWPVAIVQHGITRSRTDALAIADAFADACTIVVSMDLPLHGITATDPADPLTKLHCFLPPHAPNPACLAGTPYAAYERTFDVDIDGVAGIDSSGAYMINLVNPVTARDNLRQGEADLIQLSASVPGLAVAQAAPGSLPAGPVGVNANHVGFVGLSLGSIVGGTYARFTGDITSAALSVPGGVLTKLLLDSATFGDPIRAALAAKGLAPNSTLFGQFFRDFQTVVDGGDPFNHIAITTQTHPTLLFKVLNDKVVPNNSTDRLIYVGDLTKITSGGYIPVAAGAGVWSFFNQGSHGTLFDPSASLPATIEMQTQAVSFTASGGTVVAVDASSGVLDLTPVP